MDAARGVVVDWDDGTVSNATTALLNFDAVAGIQEYGVSVLHACVYAVAAQHFVWCIAAVTWHLTFRHALMQ